MLPQVKGAFSLVFMDENTLYAARDPQGIRPLVLGRLERGWVIASETAALDIVGASLHPRGRAGRDRRGRRATGCARTGSPRPDPKGCLFEFVYLARPDTHDLRPLGPRRPGSRSAAGWPREHPVDADLVIADPGVRHAGRDRVRRGVAASRTARAWSRTPTSAARSSSRGRPSASSASG